MISSITNLVDFLPWWGLMAGLDCLCTWWIFYGGGAETIERHHDLYMAPSWPASKIRVGWLVGLAIHGP